MEMGIDWSRMKRTAGVPVLVGACAAPTLLLLIEDNAMILSAWGWIRSVGLGGLRMPRMALQVACVLMGLAATVRACDHEVVAGPFVMTRGTGAPVVEEVNFIVPAELAKCSIRIDNDAGKPVSSAEVSLNGRDICAPNDFNGRPARLERDVVLTATSTLRVKCQGAPGSTLCVSFIPQACWLQPFYGPERFTRQTGKPVTEQRQLRSAGGDGILRLTNGDGCGKNAVSSATILIDGKPVFKPDDLNQQIRSLAASVTLKPTSTLSVSLASAPGSYLSLSIALKDCRPLTVAFASTASTASEAVEHPVIPVVLNRPSPTPVTVGVWVAGGTASAGRDFTLSAATITIPAGSTTAAVPLALMRDGIAEGPETVILGLGSRPRCSGWQGSGSGGPGDDGRDGHRHGGQRTDEGRNTRGNSGSQGGRRETGDDHRGGDGNGAEGGRNAQRGSGPGGQEGHRASDAGQRGNDGGRDGRGDGGRERDGDHGGQRNDRDHDHDGHGGNDHHRCDDRCGEERGITIGSPDRHTLTITDDGSLTVPVITWATPSPIVYGTALSGVQLSATTTTAGSFAYTPAAGMVLNAGTSTLRVVFTPTDTAHFATATASVSLVVQQARPVVTWPAPEPITYGTGLGATQLSATAAIPGIWAYTPPAGTILSAGTQTLNVVFTPTDTVNYTAASASATVVVQKAQPVLAWNPPTPIDYGTALGDAQLRATSTATGAFSYTPAAGTVLGAGTHALAVLFTPADAANYTTASATVPVTVRQAVPVLSWVAPPAITYGTALGAAQLSATAAIAGTMVYTPASGTMLPAGGHVLRVDFTPADTANYTTATASVPLTVQQAVPAITWPAPAAITYGTALGAAQLSATASTPGDFVYTPAAGTVLDAGTRQLSLVFTPTDAANFTAATASVALAVDKAVPHLTWNNPTTITAGTALGSVQLNAQASVPGTFSYTPAMGVVLPAGTHSLRADFTPGDAQNYATATISVVLTVLTREKITPVLTWHAPAPITYGNALGGTQLSATASAPGQFVYTPPAGTVLAAGEHTLAVAFTPADPDSYTTAAAIVSLTVQKAPTSVAWAAPSPIVYGTALGAGQFTATASVPGTLVYTPAEGAVLAAGSQVLTVAFTPADAANFLPSSTTVVLPVQQATPVLTWGDPAAITYGAILTPVQLNAAATVPGTLTYAPGLGALLSAGSHDLRVDFTPADAGNYTAVSATARLRVDKAATTITWASPAAVTYGTALDASQLSAVASVPGVMAYDPPAGTVLNAGSHTLRVEFMPTDSANYLTASSTVPMTVAKAVPSITWTAPAAITYGTALGAAQLSAMASVPGTMTYTPAAGAILPVGTQTLQVAFAPTDNANYLDASAQVPLLVAKARPTVTWATPAAIIYGTPLGATELSAVASVPGTFAYAPAAGTVCPAGEQVLTATLLPADSANIESVQAQVSLTVAKAPSALTWAEPAPVVYGTPLGSAQLHAVGSIPGAIIYTPAAGTVLGAGTHGLTATLVPADAANYASATASVTQVVLPSTPVIRWLEPQPITYGVPLGDAQLNAVGSVPGRLDYAPVRGAVLPAGSHTLAVTLVPLDGVNYQTVHAEVTQVVVKATPTIQWQTPAVLRPATALSSLHLNAAASTTGSFVYTPPAGTALPLGSHELSVAFTPLDQANVNPATASVTVQVQSSAIALTWANPASIVHGTALSATQLNATAPIAGQMLYTPDVGAVLPAGVQQLSVLFMPADAQLYQPISARVSIVVAPATPVLDWRDPQPIGYGTALTGTQLNATASTDGTFAYIPIPGAVLPVGTHRLAVLFTPRDAANYATVGASVLQIVNKGVPQLAWARPTPIAYGTALSATQCNATASVPGTFQYEPGLGGMLPAGTHPLRAVFTASDDLNYVSGGVVTVEQVVTQVTPSIQWSAPEDIVYGTPVGPVQLNAQSSVPGVLAYIPAPGTVLPAGQHTLTVSLTPNDAVNVVAGVSAQVTITVRKAQPLVTWAAPSAIPFGTALSAAQLAATGSVPGAIAYDPPTGFIPPVGEQTLTAVLTPDDPSNYLPAMAQVVQHVLAGPVSVTWDTPAPITYGTALDGAQLNAVASEAGSMSYEPPAGTVLPAGIHTLQVLWTPVGGSPFAPQRAMVRLVVTKQMPVITWAMPSAAPYGTPLSAAQLNATASVPGAFTYEPAAGTILDGGSRLLRARFSPEDFGNYLSDVPAQTTWTITPVLPVITWPKPADIAYGTPLGTEQLNAQCPAAGTFLYTPGPGALLPAGDHPLSVVFTPSRPDNHQSATASTVVTVRKATPSLEWPQPEPYRYPAKLTANQLNASSPVAGVITYDVAADTLFEPGPHDIQATLVPTDTINYLTASVRRTVVVEKGLPTITWTAPAPILEGTALTGAQLNAVGSVPGPLTYEPALGAVLPVGTQTLATTLQPADQAHWESATATVRLEVLSRVPVITWADPEPIVYGTELTGVQLNASTSMPGSFAYDPPIGSVLPAGQHILRCVFTPTASFQLEPVSATVHLIVTKARPAVEWPALQPVLYPTALGPTQLNARSVVSVRSTPVIVTGSFSYVPGQGSILPVGVHVLRVHFIPDDATSFLEADGTTTLSVNDTGTGTGGSGNGGGTDPDSVIPPLGGGDDNVDAVVTHGEIHGGDGGSSDGGGGDGGGGGGGWDEIRKKPVKGPLGRSLIFLKRPPVVWEMPRPLAFGTPLDGGVLNATSPVAGSFIYSKQVGDILAPGTHTISAEFVPQDRTVYTRSFSWIRVQVVKELPVVTWNPATPVAAGTVLGPEHLNAISSIAGVFTYSLPLGTPVEVDRVLRAVFEPTDSSRYQSVTATRRIACAAGSRVIPVIAGKTLMSKKWEDGSVITQADIEEVVGDPVRPGVVVQGRFVSQDVGRTLVAGSQVVTVQFHPFDQLRYGSATVVLDLTVFKRATPPLWLGSPAVHQMPIAGAVGGFQSVVGDKGGGSRHPVVQVTWSAPSGEVRSLALLRMDETEYQPIRPMTANEPFVLTSQGTLDAFPFWAEPAGERRLARKPQWETIATLDRSATGFIDADVAKSWMDPAADMVRRRYHYRIRSMDDHGASTYSQMSSVEMPFERPELSGPAHLQVVKNGVSVDGSEQFLLSWTAPADISWVKSYDIYMASAVEEDRFPDVPAEFLRNGQVEHRHRWIRIGATTDTAFLWTDNGHPDLLWSTIPRFANPDADEEKGKHVDPWTVEHCRPSYLFKVIAVGTSRQHMTAEQSSLMVTVDGNRESLVRPRLSNRMKVTGETDWRYQDLQVGSDAGGLVTIQWSPIVYGFSPPAHLAKGPYQGLTNFMDWGVHRVVIICDGKEIGSYRFNTASKKASMSCQHRPGGGRHTYAVRIVNYFNLSCLSREVALDVSGPVTAVGMTDVTPYNLALDRSDDAIWTVSWLPRAATATGSSYRILRDGTGVGSSTASPVAIPAQNDGSGHSLQIALIASNGDEVARSIVYPVPAESPPAGAMPPRSPTAPPTLRAVTADGATLAWPAPAEADAIGYDLARDGRVIARVARSGQYSDVFPAGGTYFSYQLRTVTWDDRRSGWGPGLQVRIPIDRIPPSAITGVVAAEATDGGVEIAWQAGPAADGIASYLVYKDGRYLGTTTGTTYVDASAPDGRLHAYAITAVDRAGNAGTPSALASHRATPHGPPIPRAPTAYLVQRLREGSFPLTEQGIHTSYAVEVSWEPLLGEGGAGLDVAAYRVYRNGTRVADVPLRVLVQAEPLSMEYGGLLSRTELLLRGGAYYDGRRCRNVWVDTALALDGAWPRYAMAVVSRSGQESAPTEAVTPVMPASVLPRRPEILGVRHVTAHSLVLEMNAWPVTRADPYHNLDVRVNHGPGAPGWPTDRIDSLQPIPYRTTDCTGAAVGRNLLDDVRIGGLLTAHLFGGGDGNWRDGQYLFATSVAAVRVQEPGETFVGSGAQSWSGGAYAETDLSIIVNGERRPVPRNVVTGWDVDDRPCRVQEIRVDGLQPGIAYDLVVVARTVSGQESRSAPWRVSTMDPAVDGFGFLESPRLVGPAEPYAGSFALKAQAITANGTDDGVIYSWRHLTESASFVPNERVDAKRTVVVPAAPSWGDSSGYWSQIQTIRCYITYLGRTKYMDIDVRPPKPVIAFDPASFPIYPNKKPVSP
jgi:hypothetical protein